MIFTAVGREKWEKYIHVEIKIKVNNDAKNTTSDVLCIKDGLEQGDLPSFLPVDKLAIYKLIDVNKRLLSVISIISIMEKPLF